MSQKSATYDASGLIIGFYDSVDSPVPDGAQSIKITDEQWQECISNQGWTVKKGKLVAPLPFVPSPEQVQADKVAVVQRHMDAAAQSLNYDSIATACTYAEEPSVPKFQSEGQAFRAWRSAVWATCYSLLAEVNDGDRKVPTDKQLVAALPKLKLPEEKET